MRLWRVHSLHRELNRTAWWAGASMLLCPYETVLVGQLAWRAQGCWSATLVSEVVATSIRVVKVRWVHSLPRGFAKRGMAGVGANCCASISRL